MRNLSKVWLAITWIGIGLEGAWFLAAFGLAGIDLRYPLNSFKLIFLFGFWLGMVMGAFSFNRRATLLPSTALANLIGCVAMKVIPWNGARDEWLHFAYGHSIDVLILVSSYLAYQERARQLAEWQQRNQAP
jgi:peptidoglycan/LPS O-acetylase OafA/YrhL